MSKYRADRRDLARVFKALSHPTRLRIFEEVRRHCCVAEGRSARVGGFHVGDIYALVDVAPSTVSHHLDELKQAGLLVERRAGTFLFLTVGGEALAALARFANGTLPATHDAPEPGATGGGEHRRRNKSRFTSLKEKRP